MTRMSRLRGSLAKSKKALGIEDIPGKPHFQFLGMPRDVVCTQDFLLQRLGQFGSS